MDGGAVSRTQVIVGTFLALRDVLAGVHAEVRTRVEQELPLADFVHYEDAACRLRADMCHR